MKDEKEEVFSHLWSLFYEMVSYIAIPEFQFLSNIKRIRETSKEISELDTETITETDIEKYFNELIDEYWKGAKSKILPMPEEWKNINNLSNKEFIEDFIIKYKGVWKNE